MSAKFWTDERVTELRHLTEVEKFTAKQCATKFGVTRSAVIGAWSRNGIKSKNGMLDTHPRPIGERPKRAKRAKKQRQGPRILPKLLPASAPREIPIRADVKPISILELNNATCRWPIGERYPYLFCGALEADLEAGVPYCPYHFVVAIKGGDE